MIVTDCCYSSIEIDCGSLTNDVEGMWKFREQSLMLLNACRDPATESAMKEVELPKPVRAFEGLGREFNASLSRGTRRLPSLPLLAITATDRQIYI